MVETPYEAETLLQELLALYPALLAGDDDAVGGGEWLLIRREASVVLGHEGGPRGSLDHLFVDAAGVPTLVEVKRSSDGRVRREVVGQMLDYAANAAAYWKDHTLRRFFEERCAADGLDPDATVRASLGPVDDVDTFWEAVRTNLAAERLRLVFVADEIPPELRRIVEYLNGQMTQTEVLAIEVKQYRDASGAHETLVPRVIGQTEAARQVKGRAEKRAGSGPQYWPDWASGAAPNGPMWAAACLSGSMPAAISASSSGRAPRTAHSKPATGTSLGTCGHLSSTPMGA